MAFCGAAPARDAAPVSVAQLPVEAREVLKRIETGGPFKYDRDGIDFGNRERLLPGETRGYYREYTVETPGLRHRGARRLVVGCARAGAAARRSAGPGPFSGFRDCSGPAHVYYTEDHYQSFRPVMP
jgi:ribonuclease T1